MDPVTEPRPHAYAGLVAPGSYPGRLRGAAALVLHRGGVQAALGLRGAGAHVCGVHSEVLLPAAAVTVGLNVVTIGLNVVTIGHP